MRGKDASNRCKATAINQPVQQKNKRAAQHECQGKDSNGDNDIGGDDCADNNDNDNYGDSGSQHQEINHVLS